MAFLKKYRYELLLVLLAIGWVYFVSFAIQFSAGYSTIGDDWSYLTAAKKLYFDGLPDEGRPFGIAALFGLPFLLGGSASTVIAWGICINFASWAFSILLVFWTLSRRISYERAFWFAVLFLLCIGNLAVARRFIPEAPFIALLLFAVYLLNRFDLTRKAGFLSGALAVLFFAVLIKPIALGLALIVIVFHFKSLKSAIKTKISVFVYVAIALIALQMNEMKKAYGDFTISYIGNITYYNYLGAKADCLRKGIAFVPGENERAKHFQKFSSHDQTKMVKNDMIEQLQNNTINFVKAYLYCMYANSSKGSYLISECTNKADTFYFDAFHWFFKAVSKVQNIVLTAIGILLSLYVWVRRKKSSAFQRLLALATLYIFFISAMSCFQTDRFHIVFFPLVLIMIAEFYQIKKADTKPA